MVATGKSRGVTLGSLVDRTGLRALTTDGRGPILAAIAGGWFLSIDVRLVYPVLLPHIRESYGLTLTTAGLPLTILWLAYAVVREADGTLVIRDENFAAIEGLEVERYV